MLRVGGLFLVLSVVVSGCSTSGSRTTTTTSHRSAPANIVFYAAGDISPPEESDNTAATARLITTQGDADAILALGDLQYQNGELENFEKFYDPTWGALKVITYPAPGNHEYGTENAAGYYEYFGPAAHEETKGFYATELGDWLLLALNSNCDAIGGCGPDSDQGKFIAKELADAPECVLAFDHHPALSAGSYKPGTDVGQTLFDQLDGVDLFLSGHDHNYQRFDPDNGVTQFVVGTGGNDLYELDTTDPRLAVANDDKPAAADDVHGVLRLVLKGDSYKFDFLPTEGEFSDSGTGDC